MPRGLHAVGYEDGRVFVHIPLDHNVIAHGWRAFEVVEHSLRRLGLNGAKLDLAYYEDNYGNMVGVFEVNRNG